MPKPKNVISIGEFKAEAADSTATPLAHYQYTYDGDGNIVRSIDICGKKEYNYEYEESKIIDNLLLRFLWFLRRYS